MASPAILNGAFGGVKDLGKINGEVETDSSLALRMTERVFRMTGERLE